MAFLLARPEGEATMKVRRAALPNHAASMGESEVDTQQRQLGSVSSPTEVFSREVGKKTKELGRNHCPSVENWWIPPKFSHRPFPSLFGINLLTLICPLLPPLLLWIQL